jgi:abortive infection bacteriophage resistance protein
MPRKSQRTVTLPAWVVDLVKKEFESKKEFYVRLGIKSWTKLVQVWLLQHVDVKSWLSDTSV